MRKTVTALFMALAVGVAGCGGSPKPVTPPPAANTNVVRPACNPAPNKGHLGVCTPHQRLTGHQDFRAFSLPTNQGLVPDVYEGDTVYSWQTAMQNAIGAIVKVYEYRQDYQFASNWQQLKAIGKWHAAYIFMHGTCSRVDAAVAAVNAQGGFNQAHVGPLILDIETSDAAGVAACAVNEAKRLTGRTPIIYTAPGTWPGGDPSGAYEWAAGYGNYSHSPCIWTCSPVAWQYTDGTYGPYPHQIPGIQPGDISVSYGITNLVASNPYAVFPTIALTLGGHYPTVERYTVQVWDREGCRNPVIRATCVTMRGRMVLLRGRLYWIATHLHGGTLAQPNWAGIGDRFQYLSKRIELAYYGKAP